MPNVNFCLLTATAATLLFAGTLACASEPGPDRAPEASPRERVSPDRPEARIWQSMNDLEKRLGELEKRVTAGSRVDSPARERVERGDLTQLMELRKKHLEGEKLTDIEQLKLDELEKMQRETRRRQNLQPRAAEPQEVRPQGRREERPRERLLRPRGEFQNPPSLPAPEFGRNPLRPLANLNLSPDQREAIQRLLADVREREGALAEKRRQANRELDEAAKEARFNEERIGEKAAQIGRIESELALARAKTIAQLRRHLTPDQLEQVIEMRRRANLAPSRLQQP
jgi:Spy/CpxP family protein refolding chaperone